MKRDKSWIYGAIGRVLIVGSIVLAMTAKMTPNPLAIAQVSGLMFMMGCVLWGDAQQARRIAALEERVLELEKR